MIQAAILVLSVAALIGMICRIDGMTWRTHRAPVVAMNVAWGIAAGQSALQALEGVAGVEDAALAVGVLCWLWISWPTWADGPPPHTESRPAPLQELTDEELQRVWGGRSQR